MKFIIAIAILLSVISTLEASQEVHEKQTKAVENHDHDQGKTVENHQQHEDQGKIVENHENEKVTSEAHEDHHDEKHQHKKSDRKVEDHHRKIRHHFTNQWRVNYIPKCPIVDTEDGGADFGNVFASVFTNFVHSDGRCEPGYDKAIIDGNRYNRPGEKRCACFKYASKDNEACPATYVVSHSSSSSSSSSSQENGDKPIIVCPPIPKAKVGDTIDNYYKERIPALKDYAPSDGCCPTGTNKFIFQKERTGLNRDICACWFDHFVTENDEYPFTWEYTRLDLANNYKKSKEKK